MNLNCKRALVIILHSVLLHCSGSALDGNNCVIYDVTFSASGYMSLRKRKIQNKRNATSSVQHRFTSSEDKPNYTHTLQSWHIGRVLRPQWPRNETFFVFVLTTWHPVIRKKLALTSLTSGGRSVGIVRSRTQTMELIGRNIWVDFVD
jgi:hypothetical protein